MEHALVKNSRLVRGLRCEAFGRNIITGNCRVSPASAMRAGASSMLSPNFWLQSVHHYLDERGWHKLADWFDVSHFIPLAFFSAVDVLQKMVRGKTSNFRMVARKPVI